MARPWRIQYGGAYYHVLSRGNEGRDIFFDDGDRKLFLGTKLPDLSRAMRWLGRTYSAFCHIVRDRKERITLDPRLGRKLKRLNSQFKMCGPKSAS